MISRPILGCSHWLEFVDAQNADVILPDTLKHLDYVHKDIFIYFDHGGHRGMGYVTPATFFSRLCKFFYLELTNNLTKSAPSFEKS